MRERVDVAPRGRRNAVLVESVVVACLVFIAYAIARPDPVATLGRLYDDSVYLSIGKSIAEGGGYRSAQLVGTPVHVKFPPLLPAIYAGAWRAFGTLDAVAAAALWLNIVVAAACAGLLWWIARRELDIGPVPAVLFCITPLLTARTMFYFSGAMGEPWMLLGWTGALVVVRRLTRRHADAAPVAAAAVALGLILAATGLARTQGLAVALGVLAGALLGGIGRRAFLIATAVMLAPLTVWGLWHGAMVRQGPISTLPDQTGYLSWIPLGSVGEFAAFATRVAAMTTREYWSTAPIILVGWESPKTTALAGMFLVAAVVGSIWLARRMPVVSASLAAIAAVLVIWPYAEDRFLTPLLPVAGLAAAYAVQRILDASPLVARRVALSGAGLLALGILGLSARTRRDALRGEAGSPFVLALNRITGWVNDSTGHDAHVMAPWGGVIYLRTGRRTSIGNPEEAAFAPSVLEAPQRFYASRLLADSVDVVVIWDGAPGRSAGTLRDMAARCPALLAESVRSPSGADAASDVHFYRVRRDAPCLGRFARGDTIALPAENKNAP